jgi:hypothetical protein
MRGERFCETDVGRVPLNSTDVCAASSRIEEPAYVFARSEWIMKSSRAELTKASKMVRLAREVPSQDVSRKFLSHSRSERTEKDSTSSSSFIVATRDVRMPMSDARKVDVDDTNVVRVMSSQFKLPPKWPDDRPLADHFDQVSCSGAEIPTTRLRSFWRRKQTRLLGAFLRLHLSRKRATRWQGSRTRDWRSAHTSGSLGETSSFLFVDTVMEQV